MNLKEFMEGMPGDRILYVGSKSAFMVAGFKNSVLEEIPKMDKKLLDTAEKKRKEILASYRNAQRKFGKQHDITKSLHSQYVGIKDPMPIMEREVLDSYERQTEDAINILVTGDESGNIWSIHEKEKFEIEFHEEELVGAILREAVRQYQMELRAELIEMKKCLTRLEEYRTKSEKMERYLRSDDVKRFFSMDCEYLIDTARKALAETLAEKTEKKNRAAQKGKHGEKKKMRDGTHGNYTRKGEDDKGENEGSARPDAEVPRDRRDPD